MNRKLTKLFNDGVNTGDITIICTDGQLIHCHSFVLESECEFMKGYQHFTQEQQKLSNEIKTISLDYSSNIITIVLNKMYSSEYQIPDISVDEIFLITKLMDEIIMTDIDSIMSELTSQFEKLLTKDNWFDLLCFVSKDHFYCEFEIMILSFFSDTLLLDDTFEIDNYFNNEINFDPEIIILLLKYSINKIKKNKNMQNDRYRARKDIDYETDYMFDYFMNEDKMKDKDIDDISTNNDPKVKYDTDSDRTLLSDDSNSSGY